MRGGKKWISAMAAMALLITAACGSNTVDQGGVNNKPAVEASTSIALSINECNITLNMEDTSGWWIDPAMMFVDVSNRFKFGIFEGWNITVNGTSVDSEGQVEVNLERLRKNESIEIKAKTLDGSKEKVFHIRTLNYSFPWVDYTISEVSPPKQGYYYTVYDSQWLVKVRTDGEIIFYRDAGCAFDFKPIDVAGFTGYSYIEYLPGEYEPAIPSRAGRGYVNTKAVVLDEQYYIKDRIFGLLNKDNEPTYPLQPLENHDFLMLGNNHYLVSAYVPKRVTNIPDEIPHSEFGTRVLASTIQEIKDGKLIWQWDSTEHPETYGWSVEQNDYFNEEIQWNDYVHFNSMYIDPKDDNLICSFRHMDTVLKLDRRTGEIIWVLGGKGDQFGLSEEQKFSRQHFANYTDEHKLVLFDNGTNILAADNPLDYTGMKPGVSRVMRFELDEKNKKAITVESFSMDEQKSPAMGSAQELGDEQGDVFVVSWGLKFTPNALFSEIDFTNKIVKFEAVNPDVNQHIYRVYKSNR